MPPTRTRSAWDVLAVLVVYALVQGAAVYVFMSGFLLTRYVVDQRSTCAHRPALTPASTPPGLVSAAELWQARTCWQPALFRKAVVLIIDALRYDFVLYNASSTETAFYANKLPVIRDTLMRQPHHGFLFKFMADPPTTTMQRIKGITTGGMPTFIDAADNFDPSQTIKEDNWIDQIASHGGKIVFLGDDTWTSVYPTQFYRAHPFPSLIVKDLHTVDNGVLRHLIPTINGSEGEWDVLLAHFLGVDHVGHSFGSDHPAMAPKLAQMNEAITDVMAAMDEDTLLIVMGDHGMTPDGNHGGATGEELAAALFVYSKTPLNAGQSRYGNPVLVEQDMIEIKQVDLAPTIALLLGVPVPYGNLGAVISELFSKMDRKFLRDESENFGKENMSNLKLLCKAEMLNAAQIQRYLLDYSERTRQFPEGKMAKLRGHYETLGATNCSQVSSAAFHEHFMNFHREASDMCEDLWTTFDTQGMVLGGSLMVAAVFSLIASVLVTAPSWQRIVAIISVALCALPLFAVIISFALSVVLVGALTLIAMHYSFESPFASLPNWDDLVSVALIAMRIGSLNSNSYIEAEEFTLFYFLLTLTLTVFLPLAIKSRQRSLRALKHVFLLVFALKALIYATGGKHELHHRGDELAFVVEFCVPLVVIAFALHSMRVLSLPYLSIVFVGTVSAVYALPFHPLIAVFEVFVAAFALPCLLASATSISSPIRYYLTLVSGLLAVYWSAVRIGATGEIHTTTLFATLFRVYLPQFIYLASIACLIMLVAGIIHPRSQRSAVCVTLTGLYPPMALSLGFKSTAPFLLLTIIVLVLISLTDEFPITMLTTSTFLSMLMSLFFYQTGHRPDFSALQFQSAFVGLDSYNPVLSGVLLLMNTFVAQIVFPLLLVLFVRDEEVVTGQNTRCSPQPLIFPIFMTIHALSATMTMIFTGFQRRHLMVWRIFAPKYIFDGAMLLAQNLFLALAFLHMIRMQRLQRRNKLLAPQHSKHS